MGMTLYPVGDAGSANTGITGTVTGGKHGLDVNVINAASIGGGTEATEDSAAETTGPQFMGRYDATPRTLDDGDAGGVAIDPAGRVYVVMTDENGDAVAIDSFGNVGATVSGNVGHDAADSGNPLKVGGKASTATPTAVANNDRVDAYFDEYGRQQVNVTELAGPGAPVVDSYTHYAWNLTTGANQVLAASAANKQIWVYGYGFTCGDADGQTVSFQDEDDTPVTGIMEFAQYGGMAVAPSGNFSMPLFKLATDKDLEVDITGGDVDGWIAYAVVDVS